MRTWHWSASQWTIRLPGGTPGDPDLGPVTLTIVMQAPTDDFRRTAVAEPSEQAPEDDTEETPAEDAVTESPEQKIEDVVVAEAPAEPELVPPPLLESPSPAPVAQLSSDQATEPPAPDPEQTAASAPADEQAAEPVWEPQRSTPATVPPTWSDAEEVTVAKPRR